MIEHFKDNSGKWIASLGHIGDVCEKLNEIRLEPDSGTIYAIMPNETFIGSLELSRYEGFQKGVLYGGLSLALGSVIMAVTAFVVRKEVKRRKEKKED